MSTPPAETITAEPASRLLPITLGEDRIRLSALVITKNEAGNIQECLASLHWVQEIIVVDAESEDNTAALAHKFTNKVFVRKWQGYAAARQFALEQCHGEWVLWVDADERVPVELREEICALLSGTPACAAYELPRLANFLGRWIMHGGWYPGHVVRLFRRELADFNHRRIHEGVEVRGRIGRLQNHLLHYTDRDLRHYFEKFNRYTSLAAEELQQSGRRFHWWDLLFRPPWMFLRMYVFKTGFLDGLPGFILACLSSAYVFTKYAKLWELEKNAAVR
ncbi:MAG: glycosyltransferase family 2 protein [candidate division KSB1 bacterium]|nr:glycosyltransferase family 2 protein [candidate division KSB1 bacterium]MDZ7272898.1 glycosyltransferase family 2 protein [candidate division KSB1 bacterium]MDZ7284080.1 glycosyltransferase family 2 protein [candidate division KSB1 bacterium]MDZ7297523.1 glycosyltransferase family 2 protein [candidate division KSB1 bacterium]MDZ7308259.1 glycosyltransferase family 2 protein [candidate division KSB1 bacterium]